MNPNTNDKRKVSVISGRLGDPLNPIRLSRQSATTALPHLSQVYLSSTRTIREFCDSLEVLRVVEEYKLGHYDTLDFVRKISTIKGYDEAMSARDTLSNL